ncbi:sarcosine oxidase subunit beta [Nocardioides albertanoniae]|uniref:Sarcosine oxidase subunit beta n=1 Tax=Nocardioides albertanoniae TaxID=1175486 RepID=A0A543A1H3_9ACTN|nr:FAD-binding oxidoreductase [Nocardioides albertanoniae]TQL66404.1 sarcosine oxidase subunit beta [Nocardioides albertanoniae]
MSYRFIIAGAGVYGSATAWHLARSGADVLVLEAGEVASGASGGTGKRGVRGSRRAPAELPALRLAYELWPALADELDADTGYHRIGSLNLFEEDEVGMRGGEDALRAWAWRQRRLGVPTEALDAAGVRELEPEVADSISGALWSPFDGVADHTATTRAYAAAAARHGAVVTEHSPVAELLTDGDRTIGVVTAGGTTHLASEAVVLLNNVGAAPLVQSVGGGHLPFWSMYPQALSVRTPSPSPCRHLVSHQSRALSLKTLDAHTLMVTGGWRGVRDEADGSGRTVESAVRGNLAAAVAAYPSLADAELLTWQADRAETYSADDLPVVDTVAPYRNLFVGAGFSGHGFAIAPAVSLLLSRWLLTGVRPDELAPLGYHRFTPAVSRSAS